MPGKTAGIVKIKIGGVDYGTKPGWSFDMGGVERTTEVASGEVDGTFETPVPSKFSGSVTVKSTTDLEALRNFDGGDVTYINDVGHEYVARDSTMVKPPVVMGEGQGVKLEIEGKPAIKVAGP